MTEPEAAGARVAFAGTRRELFALLLAGYALMLPTLGIYRFWVTTRKRHYYWKNTVIGGEPLDYTGNPMQLLVGFLFAVVFFLPLYLVLFYLSTQSFEVVGLGYVGLAALFWFMTGYAQYRARDFRLSRTLWRGIRFDQRGSAWVYALKRFAWSILVVLTLGLAYPFMATSLWRYRYGHSWYGDRQFRWTGSWKTIGVPFYLSYLLSALGLALAIGVAAAAPAVQAWGQLLPSPGAIAALGGALLFALLMWFYFRARATSRMFSEVWIGEARARVDVSARALLWQSVLYLLAVLAALVVLALALGAGAYLLSGDGAGGGNPLFALARSIETSWIVLVAVILGYLVVFGTFALLGEVFLGYGYWMLVARHATVSNIESLDSVRAAGEDRALAGEGFADALNVGGY